MRNVLLLLIPALITLSGCQTMHDCDASGEVHDAPYPEVWIGPMPALPPAEHQSAIQKWLDTAQGHPINVVFSPGDYHITDPAGLLNFSEDGYAYNPELSAPSKPVFTRPEAKAF